MHRLRCQTWSLMPARTRQLSGPRLRRGSSFMAIRVPTTVATEPMQKDSSRRPVDVKMRLSTTLHISLLQEVVRACPLRR